MRIAIDAMGGDFGVDVTVPAAIQSLIHNVSIEQILLFGDKPDIQSCLNASSLLQASPQLLDRLSIVHSDHVVDMSAKPADVLRQRQDTSMLLALNAVADGVADACVTAGNTGALVGLARHSCGLVEGIKRLAICAQLPTSLSNTFLLDVGGNVDCSGEQLHQFARMGCALVNALNGRDEKVSSQPRVRALSIGTEAGKGNSAVNAAVQLCEADSQMHFEGLIEGNQLLEGVCDVIFCDGFVGNIALKSCEGAASYIRSSAHELLKSESVSSLNDDYARLMQAIDPEQFNGAVLLGLKQPVIKSHGSSGANGFAAAIQKAVDASEGQLIEKLEFALH
ncbi:MAG: phosphate acyltransferase PlsX [Cellvibrionales bacterium]|nr:phosphate acyltransferase PlsX [Cellvibrionales bacterium]